MQKLSFRNAIPPLSFCNTAAFAFNPNRSLEPKQILFCCHNAEKLYIRCKNTEKKSITQGIICIYSVSNIRVVNSSSVSVTFLFPAVRRFPINRPPPPPPWCSSTRSKKKARRKKQEEESKKEKRRKQAVIIKNQPRIPQSFLTKIKRARKKRKNRKKNAKSFAGSGKSSTFALAFRKTVQLRRQKC